MVAYYALLDLRPFQGRADATVTDAILQAFSPAAYVEAGTAPALPILVARAGQDQPTLNGTIDAFVQGALAANLPIEVLNHPGSLAVQVYYACPLRDATLIFVSLQPFLQVARVASSNCW